MTGGYGHFTTTKDGITVELVESQNDRGVYNFIFLKIIIILDFSKIVIS